MPARPIDKVYAVLGGFHLGEPLIPRVCEELKRLSPGVIVPAHCTGWRPSAGPPTASARPRSFPNTVGTRFEL